MVILRSEILSRIRILCHRVADHHRIKAGSKGMILPIQPHRPDGCKRKAKENQQAAKDRISLLNHRSQHISVLPFLSFHE